MSSSLVRRVGAAVLAAAVTLSLAACGTGTSAPTTSTSASARVAGATGALHAGSGYLQVGTGKIVVDTYIDPQCPDCRMFERVNGSSLAALVSGGAITLRIHPLTFLDRVSTTDYSTRASSSLACAAATSPDHLLAYLAALYANQPEEGSAGLTDATLVSLAHRSGVTGADACITSNAYGNWADGFTTKAIDGPLPDANIQSIQGTPTILVNGKAFTGNYTRNAAVLAFVNSGGAS